MRKQSMFAVALAAAAMLTLGAVATMAKGWVQVNGQWYYENASGEFVTDTIESSGSSKFYLGEDGAMATDTFVEDYDGNGYSYYFGSNGAMVTNTWVAIDPSIVSSADDNAPSAYWYYFGSNGKSYKASNDIVKKTIDGKKYAFNADGQMLTGWIADNGDNLDEEDEPFETALYYAGGENDGVLRTGWLAYYDGTELDSVGEQGTDYTDKDVLWFYFNTSNNKKTVGTTKTINGKKYAFEDNGIMKSEWDKVDPSSDDKVYKYYSGENDGHLVKKGWIYAVPTEIQDFDNSSDQDDEAQWFYALSSGEVVLDQIKKINGKYYVFNNAGEMKTGLVVMSDKGTFLNKIDPEYTEAARFIKTGEYYKGDGGESDLRTIASTSSIHYFGGDGARRTGDIGIEFSDKNMTFYSDNNGHKEGWVNKKSKFYHYGLLLAADADIKYGIVADPSEEGETWKQGEDIDQKESSNVTLRVVTTTGAKAYKDTKSGVKKDADSNYWLVLAGQFKKISTQEVKYSTSKYTGWVYINDRSNYAYCTVESAPHFEFKSDAPKVKSNGALDGTKETWIPFSGEDDKANIKVQYPEGAGTESYKLGDPEELGADDHIVDYNYHWMSTTFGDGSSFEYNLANRPDYTLNFNFK